jgi:hypothetical protein
MSTTINAPTRKTAPIHALRTSSQSANLPFPLPHIPSRQHQRLDEGTKLAIYIAGSRAHQHFLQPLGMTAYQIGVTGRRSFKDRIEDKRRRRYGSILMDTRAPEADSYCLLWGHDICLIKIWDEMFKGITIPPGLSIVDGVIEVRLKSGITTEEADKRISRMLAPRSVNRYLETPDGQKRMLGAGYNPRHLLTTGYTDIGREPRYSLAEEIYLIRPKRELQALLDAVAVALNGCIQTI